MHKSAMIRVMNASAMDCRTAFIVYGFSIDYQNSYTMVVQLWGNCELRDGAYFGWIRVGTESTVRSGECSQIEAHELCTGECAQRIKGQLTLVEPLKWGAIYSFERATP